MKASAAVWQCLRDSKESHPVWDHLARKPVEHHELPRLIDETREEAAAVAAEVARDGELLAAARDAERQRRRAAEAAAAAAQAQDQSDAASDAVRADSATDHEIEMAMPRPGKGAVGGVGGIGGGRGCVPEEIDSAGAVEA